MASIVIVTKHCYLLCETINYIAINEVEEHDLDLRFFEKRKRGKKPTKKQVDAWKKEQFQIIIDFVPANGVNPQNTTHHNGNGNTTAVVIRISGREKCLSLFSHMVEQIREQIPDNKFLDDIVEKFLQEE